MRQVPETFQQTQFFPLLIGRGRLAAHLHHYLHQIDYRHKHFDHSIHEPFEALSADARAELDRKILACNVMWVLVSDSAIASVFEKLKKRITHLGRNPDDYHFIHSSAATQIEGMTTFHPLMTFGRELYSREQYARIPFATFIGESTRALAFPLPNPHFSIPAEKRALYHACAVMMSNLPILLWSKVSNTFESTFSEDAHVFDPILQQTLSNFITHGAQALTGPIVRNDQATIQKNLAAIEGTPLFNLYQAFLERK